MKILVIGSTGLLGTDLCRVLSRNHELIGWARKPASSPRNLPERLLFETVDITDRERVADGIRRHRPAVTILTAAMSDVDACEKEPSLAMKINAHAVQHVAEGCAAAGSLLVAISTDYVFDGLAGRAYKESDSPHPINQYGLSKLEGEKMVLSAGARSVVIRVSGLFGNGRLNFVSSAAEAFLNNRPVRVVTDQINSPSSTADLALALEAFVSQIAEDPALPTVLHLANTGAASRLDVAEEIASVLKKPASLIEKTTWPQLNRPAKRPTYTELDSRLFTRLTGFAMKPWRQALREYLLQNYS
ncbi:MAG: dTDP-4-dehydrorhamnose reductase [Candidatus Omnitrophica bacterium]|nr:dTDP-4-dehydrorhamnose reductase [Candidatus Omnitrophota bacterium]